VTFAEQQKEKKYSEDRGRRSGISRDIIPELTDYPSISQREKFIWRLQFPYMNYYQIVYPSP
jgi:hypothetical protein